MPAFEPGRQVASFRVYNDGSSSSDAAGGGGDPHAPAVSAEWDAGVYEHYKEMRRCGGRRAVGYTCRSNGVAESAAWLGRARSE
jgi:hypothetical protein